MIPARRWRRTAVGVVVAADVVLVLLGAAALPGFVPFAVPVLVGATVWGLLRPGGWGALALVVTQVLAVGIPRAAPESLPDWALAAVAAAAVLVTHLALALLAAFPPGAALPVPTLRRWARQAGLLGTLGGVAAGVGLLAGSTPAAWGPWVLAAAFLLRRGDGGPRPAGDPPRLTAWAAPRVRPSACAERACARPRRRAGRSSG